MTYKEKLTKLREDSIVTQREFLKVVEEINRKATNGTALEEELLFRRDRLFHEYNHQLTEYRSLTQFTETNDIAEGEDYSREESA